MAQRTISVYPVDSSVSIQQLQKEFEGYKIEKIVINSSKNTAYIQFRTSDEVQSLANRYPDCKVPTLNYAEIGFVAEDFAWPQIHNQQFQVNANSLLVIKNCDKLDEVNEEKIRYIFKQYTIKKMVILKDARQVVLEFQNSQDLELLDMSFQDFKVPALGISAEIDIENGFDPNIFKQKFLQKKNNFLVLVEEKVQKDMKNKQEQNKEPIKREKIEQISVNQTLNGSKMSEETEIKKKMQEMQKEIMQKDRIRQAQNQRLQKQREQLQKKQRQERLNRQKQAKRLKIQEQKKQAEKLKNKQQEGKIKLEQKNHKQQEEAQMKFVAQKIANLKKQFEEIQRRQLDSAVQLKPQYDLQRIINRQKQERNQKTIQLASIHSKVHEQKYNPIKLKINQTQQRNINQKKQKKVQVKLDYSKISYNFIGFVLILWIYYVTTK